MKFWRVLIIAGPALALLAALAWLFLQPRLEADRRGVLVESEAGGVAGGAEAGGVAEAAEAAELPGFPGGDIDQRIVREKLAWARAQGLDTLPIGEAIARLGETFVGTTYTPNTLEVEGPERLVVNLRELDCVTYIENVLALVRMLRRNETGFGAFQEQLTQIRYRAGRIDGYPSRLHYFSDWIAENERKGLLRDITEELGGVVDPEPIRFMSANAHAYRQLSDPANLRAIRRMEAEISARPRHYIPQERIAQLAPRIRNGDIIAATSTLEGLDVAHTGIALWRDGRLHLMHAPLVGKSVEISELPLAERIRGIDKQDGIMVARPI